MRIVAGKYRSRVLKTLPGDNTRPTLDKVREAVFSSLSLRIENAIFLDLFSGSGAMGLEALSRGAKKAYMFDNNPKAVSIIKDNIDNLKEENAQISKMDFKQALNYLTNNQIQVDIVYLDPPYKSNYYQEALKIINDNNLLSNKGIIIMESLKDDIMIEQYQSIKKYKEAKYGTVKVTYYRREEQ